MKVYDGTQTDATPDADSEPERVKVGIAEHEVTTDGAVLTTSGLGSCLGIALYDAVADVAGLIHVMLPSADEVEDDNDAKFVDTGVDLLVERMEAAGADRSHMKAKVAGGSDMLDFSDDVGIGRRNTERVRECLTEHSVPIVGEDVGGERGRSLRFESRTGDLVVTSADEDERRL